MQVGLQCLSCLACHHFQIPASQYKCHLLFCGKHLLQKYIYTTCVLDWCKNMMVAVFRLLVVDMSDTSTIGFLDHLSTKKCQLGWAFWENVVWQGKKNQTHIFTLVLKAHTSMSNFLSSLIYQNIINITNHLLFMNNKGIVLPPSEIGLAIIAAFPI